MKTRTQKGPCAAVVLVYFAGSLWACNKGTGANDQDEESDEDTSSSFDETVGCMRVDRDCDSKVEDCVSSTFDENGHELTAQTDEGCDGTFETCMAYTRDEQGTPLQTKQDEGCDGTFESTECVAEKPDSDGSTSVIKQDDRCDGKVDNLTCMKYARDKLGNLTEVRMDANCDNSFENCQQLKYDKDGNLTSSVYTNCADPPAVKNCCRYIRKEAGNGFETRCGPKCEAPDQCTAQTVGGAC